MNCKDFENVIHELVSRRVADTKKQLEALEHAGHCLWCALRLDEETKLTERLQAFASTLQAQRAPARVEEELLRAFRERSLQTRTPLLGLAGKRLWRRLSWGLALAATAATAWFLILQWPHLRPGSSASPPRLASNQPLAPSEASRAKGEAGSQSTVAKDRAPGYYPTHAALSPAKVGSGQARKDGATPSLAVAGSGQALNGGATSQQHLGGQIAPHGGVETGGLEEFASEMATDFIPLGTCDDSQCMDEATLVRVSLPAEALMAFGFPMDSDYGTGGFVQAEVAFGSEGVPFAIRFVN